MPLDALCLSGVVHELQNALSGAKIDKIYQPGQQAAEPVHLPAPLPLYGVTGHARRNNAEEEESA